MGMGISDFLAQHPSPPTYSDTSVVVLLCLSSKMRDDTRGRRERCLKSIGATGGGRRETIQEDEGRGGYRSRAAARGVRHEMIQ